MQHHQLSVLEAERLMQALRRHVGDIDIGNHLATAGGGAGVDQSRQETPADAGSGFKGFKGPVFICGAAG
jgi:hypothetical protein